MESSRQTHSSFPMLAHRNNRVAEVPRFCRDLIVKRMKLHKDVLSRLGRRAGGFSRIFELLERKRRVQGPLSLVETGCLRSLNWAGDGCSSILFHEFSVRTRSKFLSIDVRREHCVHARRYCPKATVLCGDSVATLYRLRGVLKRIDFLYLDSLDVDWNDPRPSALHHLKELCAAAPMLSRGAIVFVDDNAENSGKPLYVKDYMQSIGARKVHDDYQIGFVMP